MDVFNPKILDASIRDVSSCLSDNQKVDLLLYAMKSLKFEGRSRTVIENAIQSCLSISTLSAENTAKARILRARARIATGSQLSAQEDLQAALQAEPDNPEAKALLHQRSVTVEKLLSPLPLNREKFSTEIWREIASFLPRRDLKALLFVPHTISRVASQLLFRTLDLHLSGSCDEDEERETWAGERAPHCEDEGRHLQRSADILTRIIVDPSFASTVRTLKIYASKHNNDAAMAFQTGMLTNALPKLNNLRNVHISAGSEGVISILRILQSFGPRLRGLSIHSPEGVVDLSTVGFRYLNEISYSTCAGDLTHLHSFIAQNLGSLRSISLHTGRPNLGWTFPSTILSIRNLSAIHFTGHFPANSHAFTDIISSGRQLVSLTLDCCALECTGPSASQQFRSLEGTDILPALRHFAFSVQTVGRRTVDRDLFPAIAEFLRGRTQLRNLQLVARDSVLQHVGFDSAVWGVLPSLTNLKTLTITYPPDLPGSLSHWLIPRSVLALNLILSSAPTDVLDQLRPGIPSTLRFIGLSGKRISNVTETVKQCFPMVRVIRVGAKYWTVVGLPSIPELDPWPTRRVLYHTNEWLEWLGCDDALISDPSMFSCQ